MEGLEGFCKGCLTKYDLPEELIQFNEKNRRQYVYSTGLQVKRNDAFPLQLCKFCYSQMKTACQFRKMCRTSDKHFKSYVALKQDGHVVDFSTYVKNTYDLNTFRFPFTNGQSSTPAHNKTRDEDTESNCTSIRNFMTGILNDDDIPDTEAKIIQQVIEEEADILDDTIDSQWLQDDASIASDAMLDFSLSPFASPHTSNNDRFVSPKKSPNLNAVNAVLNVPVREKKIVQLSEKNILAFGDGKVEKIVPDSIDRNLQAALKNAENTDISLEELLASPAYTTATPSPSISSFFKIPTQEASELLQAGKYIEHFTDAQADIDVLQDFLKTPATPQNDFNDDSLSNIENEVIKLEEAINSNNAIIKEVDASKIEVVPIFCCNICGVKCKTETGLKIHKLHIHKQGKSRKSPVLQNEKSNLSCEMCKKVFATEIGAKRHFILKHKKQMTNMTDKKMHQCHICGKEYNNKSNMNRHTLTHKVEKSEFQCDICSLRVASKHNLIQHMISHGFVPLKFSENNHEKMYKCDKCSYSTSQSANFRMHQKRHDKRYTLVCPECGKGFYRNSELSEHMRSHTDEHPFACPTCPKKFKRREFVIYHIKEFHLGEKLYSCQFCNRSFVVASRLKRHMESSKRCTKIRNDVAKGKSGLEDNGGNIVKYTEQVATGRKKKSRVEKSAKKQILCKYCNCPFKTKVQLKKHLKNDDKCKQDRLLRVEMVQNVLFEDNKSQKTLESPNKISHDEPVIIDEARTKLNSNQDMESLHFGMFTVSNVHFDDIAE